MFLCEQLRVCFGTASASDLPRVRLQNVLRRADDHQVLFLIHGENFGFQLASIIICVDKMSLPICHARHTLARSLKLLSRNLVNHNQRRYLDLQEYQSKQILQERGVRVQRFKVATNPKQIKQVLFPEENGPLPNSQWSGHKEDISGVDEFVIKAQVLAGGRGKGVFKNSGMTGGVQLTEDRITAAKIAEKMLNDRLVTKQTSQDGVLVERVMIAEAVRLKREFYMAFLLDRSYPNGVVLVTSPFGGVDIEEVAEKDEKAIRKFTIDIDLELDLDTSRRIAVAAFDLNNYDMDLIDQCADQIMKLYRLFLDLDTTQVEINPLGVTNKREVICVDAKINFDENARFRHKWIDDLEAMNRHETDSRDYEAKKHNLNFIGLDGSIGCLVNGAGLAMATMDIIKLHGGEPANFLDVGGGATASQVTEAMKIISGDCNVRAILVNIFGGIMKCDVIAEGIIQAAKTLNLEVPVICRLQGTRVDEARELIRHSGMRIHALDDLNDAAALAVSFAKTQVP